MRVASFARARMLAWRTWQASRSRARVTPASRGARVWGIALSALLPLVPCGLAGRARHRIKALLASMLDSRPQSPARAPAALQTCRRERSHRSDVLLLATDNVDFPLGLYKETVTERVPRGVDFVHLVMADRGLAARLVGIEAEAVHAIEPNSHLLVVWSRTE
jgi:hypothetical protein